MWDIRRLDTPATPTQLTTYGAQPSSAVKVAPGVAPATNTNGAPETTSASGTGASSASATASATTSTSTTSTAPTATDSPSSGLSTGAEVGIGVGAGGGVCLIAAVALVFFCWGRRGKKQKPDVAREAQPEGS
ncbi:hypothetical protein LTR53_018925, partial [Teratosphaeriaceae sp. CCFEE 6253]